MSEIEVGEYVRSKIGNIGRVTKIEDDKFLYENKELITWVENVVKHSKNIIDLIEVGDIVYTYDVLNYDVIYIYDDEMLKAVKEDIEQGIKIKTIWTKEQLKHIAFNVN